MPATTTRRGPIAHCLPPVFPLRVPNRRVVNKRVYTSALVECPWMSSCRFAALLFAALAASTTTPALALPPAVPGPATGGTPAPAAEAPSAASAAAVPAAPVSLSARKVYEQARSQLVQIRTVLKGRASQTSVGSGFLVSAQGHIITNFHVVSEAALKPDRHDLVYVTADGREAPLV